MQFDDFLRTYRRIGVADGPRTGKTTLTGRITDRLVIHTDDYKDAVHWDDVPDAVIASSGAGRVWVEGIQVPRAMRKGMQLDAVIWTGAINPAATPKQQSTGKGVLTVFRDWAKTGRTPVYLMSLSGDLIEVPARAI